MNLTVGVLLFFAGQLFGWFQLNMQKLNVGWENRPFASAVVFGLPTSVLFWYAWKIVSEETMSVWSARFIGSCTGFIIFPLLTWYMLGESMFTFKTMSCVVLSLMILFIQIYY